MHWREAGVSIAGAFIVVRKGFNNQRGVRTIGADKCVAIIYSVFMKTKRDFS